MPTNWEDLNPPYSTIVADPPWPGGAARSKGAGVPYLPMTREDIFRLPVSELAKPNSLLWLWTTAKLHCSGQAAYVAELWGWTVVGEIIWAKARFGLGTFPRPQHEAVLICLRGRHTFTVRDVGSVQHWRQVYENGRPAHSVKPPAFYDLVERVSPGPYVELFARQPRLGWDSWGRGYEETNTLVEEPSHAH